MEGKTWTCSQHELSDKAIFYTLSVIPLLFSPSSNFSHVNIILLHSFLHLLFSKPRTCLQSTYTIILQLHSPATFPTANSSFLQHPPCLPARLQVFISLCFGVFFLLFFCRKQIYILTKKPPGSETFFVLMFYFFFLLYLFFLSKHHTKKILALLMTFQCAREV